MISATDEEMYSEFKKWKKGLIPATNTTFTVELFVEEGRQKLSISTKNSTGCEYEVDNYMDMAIQIKKYIENDYYTKNSLNRFRRK